MITVTVADKRPNQNPADYKLTMADGSTVGSFKREVGFSPVDYSKFSVFSSGGSKLQDATALSDADSLIVQQ